MQVEKTLLKSKSENRAQEIRHRFSGFQTIFKVFVVKKWKKENIHKNHVQGKFNHFKNKNTTRFILKLEPAQHFNERKKKLWTWKLSTAYLCEPNSF